MDTTDPRALARALLASLEAEIDGEEETFAELAVPWVERRRLTLRDARHDVGRMNNHLIPFFGAELPSAITPALVRRYIEHKQATLSGGTIERTLALLSRFFNDQLEANTITTENPVTRLDRHSRRAARSRHDPRRVPFLRRKEDIARLYRALPPADTPLRPYRVMFAIGALAGLRPGEVIALDWQRDVDLERRRIFVGWQVSEGKLGPVKDDDGRLVPIVNSVLPVLARWRELAVTTGHETGLCFPPDPSRGGRPGSPPRFRRLHTLHKHLRRALQRAELPKSLTWYQCTRHTFASHWVSDGGSIEKLREVLGHSSVRVTERYAHLRGDIFSEADYQLLSVELCRERESAV